MSKVITRWEDCPREDLRMIPQMVAAGFTPEFSYKDKRAERTEPTNCPHDGVSFVKGDLHAWGVIDHHKDRSAWMTADLINGSYINHHSVDTLQDVIKMEKMKSSFGTIKSDARPSTDDLRRENMCE
jgi:hypothetical protein